jgi:hypothetical protein
MYRRQCILDMPTPVASEAITAAASTPALAAAKSNIAVLFNVSNRCINAPEHTVTLAAQPNAGADNT